MELEMKIAAAAGMALMLEPGQSISLVIESDTSTEFADRLAEAVEAAITESHRSWQSMDAAVIAPLDELSVGHISIGARRYLVLERA